MWLAGLLAAVGLVAALAIAGGNETPEPGGSESASTPTLAERLDETQLVGQRLITGFGGKAPSASLRERIRAGRLAGVILFAENFDSRAEAERLATELQAIPRPRGLRDPLLVTIDQEGGLVKRLPGPPSLSAEQMGAAGPGVCRRQGVATGRLLRRTGVNVDLAPVLDVARPGSAIEREHRAFGRSPGVVSRCGEAFAAALARRGIAPTAKHFPGLGAARVNTDVAVQRIGLSKRRLRRFDEGPYRRFVGDGGRRRLVMLSSAIYPAFAERPAAFTGTIARRELRRRLDFEGVSITDALGTESTNAFGDAARVARAAARAGADLLLYTRLGDAKRAAKALRPALHRDGARQRFAASVERVLELRSRLAGG